MTMLGIRLSAVPSTIGWDGLVIFCRHLPDESATMRAVIQHEADGAERWTSPMQLAQMLADLIDNVSVLRWELSSRARKKGSSPPKKPKPYERPWDKRTDEKSIGKGAISRAEFLSWYYGEEV